MRSAVLILCIISAINAFYFDFFSKKWDGLRVRFGFDLTGPYNFAKVPLTLKDAESEGYTKISEQCEGLFRGYRYLKDNDYALILVYDVQGNIAGIQAGLAENLPNGYPFVEIQPPFIKEGNRYFVTAYFVNPATICTKGRNKYLVESEGTGTNLYIQNGTDFNRDVIVAPKLQKDLVGTKWSKGNCFRSMGQHYWYDMHRNSDCRQFFPMFLMYNRGELNSFGWAFLTNIISPRFEHPQRSVISTFISDPPTCLYQQGNLTTMHIYLTDRPEYNFC
ncbi:hypothetical protein LOTGIDRAFT_232745 [Lottia gigantea]|uniref:Uncharacterized protein n=1 Tax=Lottia gigantea TaxID=225164 RepID=V4ADY4_LOTGI|nr:hypothetical protein LOTGIDRAFT_232745 [Lottia gigantea]ESO93325.1 hypothetical protein LOTGIDRAFT_232745 [Lottia gigantea]